MNGRLRQRDWRLGKFPGLLPTRQVSLELARFFERGAKSKERRVPNVRNGATKRHEKSQRLGFCASSRLFVAIVSIVLSNSFDTLVLRSRFQKVCGARGFLSFEFEWGAADAASCGVAAICVLTFSAKRDFTLQNSYVLMRLPHGSPCFCRSCHATQASKLAKFRSLGDGPHFKTISSTVVGPRSLNR